LEITAAAQLKAQCISAASPFKIPPGQSLRSLTTPQTNRLPVLLKLGNKLISLTNDVLVLLILVIRAVGLDDTAARDTIDCAGYTATGDELGQITKIG